MPLNVLNVSEKLEVSVMCINTFCFLCSFTVDLDFHSACCCSLSTLCPVLLKMPIKSNSQCLLVRISPLPLETHPKSMLSRRILCLWELDQAHQPATVRSIGEDPLYGSIHTPCWHSVCVRFNNRRSNLMLWPKLLYHSEILIISHLRFLPESAPLRGKKNRQMKLSMAPFRKSAVGAKKICM